MNACKHLAVFSLVLLLALTPIEPLRAWSPISADRAAPGGESTKSSNPVVAASLQYWAKTYGGSGDDVANAIAPTSDGGYVVAGQTTSFGAGGNDFWVLKLDGSGNIVWQKAYGGSSDDIARAIAPTSDGGYVVAGYTTSFSAGGLDVWVLKLDGSGNITWQKTYGSSGNDSVSAVVQTGDGGYLVAGNTTSFGAGGGDFWVLKLDGSGNVTWQKSYGGTNGDYANAVAPTSDGSYVVAGTTCSFGAGCWDAWVLKLDGSGNVAWQKTYGGVSDDSARAIAQTSDGGYVVAGYTWSFGAGMYDVWVLKLDGSGNLTWQKTYGGSNNDFGWGVAPTSDGGFVVAATTDSFGATGKAWVLKLDGSGSVAWQRTYGGSVGENALAIALTSDGGYAVAGNTASFGAGASDAWVLKLDANGLIGDSCSVIGSSSASAVSSSGSVANTMVAGAVTTATVGTSSASVADTMAAVATQCAFTPMVQFSAATYGINENAGAATIAATLNFVPRLPITVHYATSNGTALAGINYTATSGTLTFSAGQNLQTFAVPILDDVAHKGNVTVNLALSSPANTMLGSPSQATLTIVETDAPPLYLPLALRDWVSYFAGPCEVEPNDSYQEANGLLQSGVRYCGYANAGEPGGADKDFFSVYLLTPGTLAVDLNNYTANGQLQLYYQAPDKNQLPICYVPGIALYQRHIAYTGKGGWYYIAIASVSGFSSTPYFLTVTYPTPAPTDCQPPPP